MKRMLIVSLLLAGCVQLPQTPADTEAKKFQVPSNQSAVYVVRAPMDSWEASSLSLGNAPITTQRGTYYRWDVAPGTHRVSGFWSESLTLTTAPGKAYFLEYTVIGDPHDGGVQLTRVRQINEQAGRQLVMSSELVR